MLIGAVLGVGDAAHKRGLAQIAPNCLRWSAMNARMANVSHRRQFEECASCRSIANIIAGGQRRAGIQSCQAS